MERPGVRILDSLHGTPHASTCHIPTPPRLAIANEPHLKEQALALTPASRQKLQAQAKRRCLPESVHAQTVRRSSDRKGGAGGEHLEEEGLIDTANSKKKIVLVYILRCSIVLTLVYRATHLTQNSAQIGTTLK